MTKKKRPPQPPFPERELRQAFLLIRNYVHFPDLRLIRVPRRRETLVKIYQAVKLWNHWLDLAAQERELEEMDDQ